ncbi:FtsL-like putative cell division protein [Blattabacterium cuenoti]|uniref:FtsL-like putative cell division protein n=1 Tax=Blattabacterium cuenoti TaxID=1653831 RepID=UPI001CC25504|nr:FtsL-like putative cell division protein [Blattabacterium cuenoti]
MKMKNNIQNIKNNIKYFLKGKFLIKEDAYRSWNFIVFMTILSLISITSSHLMDKKIRTITQISEEIKELKSEYADLHSKCMKKQLASFLRKKLVNGLKHLEGPPYELVVEKDQQKKEMDSIRK